MYWTRLASVRFVCLFVWLSSSYLSGQQSACGEQAFALSVWNHSGRTVPDLGINNFRARLHGKDLKIVAVDRQSSAHRVVIVLDASGSMNPEVQQRILQKFSSEVIRSSPASTEFALVVFTDRVLETVKFGHPREEVLWAVDHLILPARGRTALRDALLYATTLFGTAHPGDSILVITDGEDNASKASPNSLEVAFRVLGVRLFFVRLYDPYFKTDSNLSNATELGSFESLAKSAGGQTLSLDPPDNNQTLAAADMSADRLANYYILRITTPHELNRVSPFEIEVVESSGKKMKGVTAALPGRLDPCPQHTTSR